MREHHQARRSTSSTGASRHRPTSRRWPRPGAGAAARRAARARLRPGQVGEQRPAAPSAVRAAQARVGPLVELLLGQPARGVVLAERGDRGLPLGVADPQLGAVSAPRIDALVRPSPSSPSASRP